MRTAYLLLLSLRPLQWTKNGFVLMPLLFARRLFHYPSLVRSLEAVVIFCILSGAMYLINDLVDLEADRRHPAKRERPLAAGLISTGLSKVVVVVLLVVSFLWGAWVGGGLFWVLLLYLIIQLLYNYRLKETVILDTFCVSAGFFLRVIAGAVAIQVEVSHWLIICTILISMFLALAKRRQEIVLLGEIEVGNHRRVLSHYSLRLLDQMIGVITASCLLSYLLYCVSPKTIEKFQTDQLIYTFPFVLYGIFRYLYLIHRENKGDAPEKALISDPPLLVDVLLWALLCILIIYGVI